jgi:hypothetical protein
MIGKYFTITILLLSSFLVAQTAPDTLWTATFGGDLNDFAKSLDITSEGGYIVTGNTFSFGSVSSDILLLKTNESGEEEWFVTLGGDYWDEARCVKSVTDGGYIVVGTTITTDGGVSDWIIIKTDETGTEEWTTIIDTDNWDNAYSIAETSENEFVVAGKIDNGTSLEFGLIKINAIGEELWTRTYGSTGNEEALDVIITGDGGYVLVGYTTSYGTEGQDFLLIKTDEDGNEQWHNTYGGEFNEVAFSVSETLNFGYIIGGYTESYGAGEKDIWLVKTNAAGEPVWNSMFGTTETEIAYTVWETPEEEYILGGWTNAGTANSIDSYIVKADTVGTLLWETSMGDVGDDKLFDFVVTDMQEIVFTGQLQSFESNSQDCWLVKYEAEEVSVHEQEVEMPNYHLQNYPNPFNPSTTISFEAANTDDTSKIEVYNIKGQLVQSLPISSITHSPLNSIVWNAENQASGIYLYKLISGGKVLESQKMLLIK